MFLKESNSYIILMQNHIFLTLTKVLFAGGWTRALLSLQLISTGELLWHGLQGNGCSGNTVSRWGFIAKFLNKSQSSDRATGGHQREKPENIFTSKYDPHAQNQWKTLQLCFAHSAPHNIL